MITEQGYSVSEAAKSLGIRSNRLYGWKAKLEEANTQAALSFGEREELKRLRKENKRLRMEKYILKKASTFFAKELT